MTLRPDVQIWIVRNNACKIKLLVRHIIEYAEDKIITRNAAFGQKTTFQGGL